MFRPDISHHQQRLKAYAETCLFGADFDPFLVRATSMNVLMMAGTTGHIFHMDSLSFPDGHLPGNALAQRRAKLGSMDIVLSNPPFGSDIPITDPHILDHYSDGIARSWRRDKEGEWRPGAARLNAVAPELLFIQRVIEWLKDGGRAGIVLPSGILSNPGDVPIRRWIIENCWILAVIDLPIETFVVQANVNIYTSLLFLKKKSQPERSDERVRGRREYPVFMAVAEKVGYDRRGNKLYKRHPDGEMYRRNRQVSEFKILGGEVHEFSKIVSEPVIDDDLPAIAGRYRSFRDSNPEPGHSS